MKETLRIGPLPYSQMAGEPEKKFATVKRSSLFCRSISEECRGSDQNYGKHGELTRQVCYFLPMSTFTTSRIHFMGQLFKNLFEVWVNCIRVCLLYTNVLP